MKQIFLLSIFLLFSCSNKEKISVLEEENQQLKIINDSLNHEAELKNHFIEEYSTTINEVYDNLEFFFIFTGCCRNGQATWLTISL